MTGSRDYWLRVVVPDLDAYAPTGLPSTIEDVSFQGSTYRVTVKLENDLRIISELPSPSSALCVP
jgi:hypothetical protein